MTKPITCPDCDHRAGQHFKGWGCEALGCECVQQPPFRPGGGQA